MTSPTKWSIIRDGLNTAVNVTASHAEAYEEYSVKMDAIAADVEKRLTECEEDAKIIQDAARWRMFISKAHAGVTEDGDIWCGFSGGEPDDYTDVLTLKQVETLNNDDPSPRMAKDIVRRLIDDLVGARASSGSTGAPDFLALLRDFDPVEAAKELNARAEQTERLCKALDEAKKVSRELLNSEITI